MLGFKAWGFGVRLLQLAHNLHLDALSLDIVEDQLVTSGSLVVDSGANSDLLFLLVLARLEGFEVLDEVPQIVVGVELVGIWVGVLSLAQLVDGS